MSQSPFTLMQLAVDAVHESQHDKNPIAAVLHGTDPNGDSFTIARTNFKPHAISEKVENGQKIGDASPWVHSEVAVLLNSPGSKDADIYITDPCCPNCAKAIAEAGVKKVHIDHKGFKKDFFERRKQEFKMALKILKDAGVDVDIVFRKRQHAKTLIKTSPTTTPKNIDPPTVEILDKRPNKQRFIERFNAFRNERPDTPSAGAFAHDIDGNTHFIGARFAPVIGQSMNETEDSKAFKYSLAVGPLNRVFMVASKLGMKVDPDFVAAHTTPSSRELVNLTGSAVTRLRVSEPEKTRKSANHDAMTFLTDHDIIEAHL